MQFPNQVITTCRYGMRQKLEDIAVIYGEDGYIVAEHFWKGGDCKRYDRLGNLQEHWRAPEENGFVHELAHFNQLLREEKRESNVMSLAMSETLARIYDEAGETVKKDGK